jgi:hypothetical protein
MEIYNLEENDLHQLSEKNMEKERHLEERLVRAESAEIGGVEILYVGRQKGIGEGSRFDILGVDEHGDMVVVELKRGAAQREVIAQALEYASKIRQAEYEYFQDKYTRFMREVQNSEPSDQLDEAHATHFDLDEPLAPEDFNNDQRLVIIASDIQNNDDLLHISDFLREHGIDVVTVEYSWYRDETEDIELLATDAIRQPLSKEPTAPSEDSNPEWKERRAEFWKKFHSLHTKCGLSGHTSKPTSASYAIEVFTDSEKEDLPYIRPAIARHDKAYIEIRFYNKDFVQDSENRIAFEEAVAEATKELDVASSPSIQDDLVWDTKEDRDFEKVRLSYDSPDHGEFTNEEQLGEIRQWFVDIARVYKFALEGMESAGRIDV